MSAWIASRTHISYVADAICRFVPAAGDDREAVTRALLAENTASVNYRYDEHTRVPSGPLYVEPTQTLTDGQVRKAAESLGYQSCEHPGWETSQAHAWIATLLGILPTARVGEPSHREAWDIPDPVDAMRDGIHDWRDDDGVGYDEDAHWAQSQHVSDALMHNDAERERLDAQEIAKVHQDGDGHRFLVRLPEDWTRIGGLVGPADLADTLATLSQYPHTGALARLADGTLALSTSLLRTPSFTLDRLNDVTALLGHLTALYERLHQAVYVPNLTASVSTWNDGTMHAYVTAHPFYDRLD